LNHGDDLSHEIIISVQIADTREEVVKKAREEGGRGGRGDRHGKPRARLYLSGDVLFAS